MQRRQGRLKTKKVCGTAINFEIQALLCRSTKQAPSTFNIGLKHAYHSYTVWSDFMFQMAVQKYIIDPEIKY